VIDTAGLAMALVDASAKLAVLALIAAAVTWRIQPSDAAAANRAWRIVLVAPVPLVAAGVLFQPVFLVMPDGSAAGPAPALAAIDRWGAAVYASVTVALLARFAIRWWAAARLVRASAVVGAADDARLRPLVDGAPVTFRESGLRVPAAAGAIEPVILLPAEWRQLPAAEIAAIMRHEHAHVLRRDYAWGLAAGLLEAVFWFHPATWVSARRMRWFAELASDHAAAGAIGTAEYARSLIGLATRWSLERRREWAVTVGGDASVVRRLHLLIDARSATRGRRLLLLAGASAMIAVFVMSPAVRVQMRTPGATSGQDLEENGPDRHASGHEAAHRLAHGAAH
jgi:beta-lactamase regulating signal transducer with metallopeptidase domain